MALPVSVTLGSNYPGNPADLFWNFIQHDFVANAASRTWYRATPTELRFYSGLAKDATLVLKGHFTFTPGNQGSIAGTVTEFDVYKGNNVLTNPNLY